MSRPLAFALLTALAFAGCGSPDDEAGDAGDPAIRPSADAEATAPAGGADEHAGHGAEAAVPGQAGHEGHPPAPGAATPGDAHAGHEAGAGRAAPADAHAGHTPASGVPAADPHAGHQVEPQAQAHEGYRAEPQAQAHDGHQARPRPGRAAAGDHAGHAPADPGSPGAAPLELFLDALLEDPVVARRLRQNPELLEGDPRSTTPQAEPSEARARLLELVRALMADTVVQEVIEEDPDLRVLERHPKVRQAIDPIEPR
ncbi:MAG: hypothetical protein KY466_11170 [Gemmatimonadetes bacterium]|nr:hypothetical protein [Gemmatimonadota bacterium]